MVLFRVFLKKTNSVLMLIIWIKHGTRHLQEPTLRLSCVSAESPRFTLLEFVRIFAFFTLLLMPIIKALRLLFIRMQRHPSTQLDIYGHLGILNNHLVQRLNKLFNDVIGNNIKKVIIIPEVYL